MPPNEQAHSLDGADRGCLHFGRHRRAASDAQRYATFTAMSFGITLLLALAFAGCAQPKTVAPSPAQAGRVYPNPRSSTLSVADFSFIGPSTTVEAAVEQVGRPDMRFSQSAGHDVLLYTLADGSGVKIDLDVDTDGRSRILRVTHGTTILFEQPR
jgi:hypothetical protein